MAESPNYLGMFIQGQQAGQQQRQQRQRQNALAMYGTDPKGAENALLAAGDIETANALTQRRMAQTKMDAEQAATQRRQTIGQQYTTDPRGARTAAMQSGDFDLVDTLSKMDDNQRKVLADNNAKVGGIAYNLLQEKDPNVRQQLWAAAQPILVQQGVLPADAQVDLSDASLQTYVNQAMDLKDKIEQGNKDRSFGLEKDKFGHTKEQDAAKLGLERQRVGMEGARLGLERQRVGLEAQRVAQTANGGLTPAQTRKAEADLRKEFDGLPEVKSYRTIRQAANTVKQFASAPPSAQGDIAITYATMKAYDPNSVVRETEFATAQNAAGVPDRIRNAYNKALSGQRLSPKQRQEMAVSVERAANSAKGRFDEIQGQYRGYAGDYGASADRVAPVSKSAPDPLGIR